MTLYKVLINELLNLKSIELSRDEVNELSEYVMNTINWCSDVNIEICNEFNKVLNEFSDVVSKLRIVKAVNIGLVPNESVDAMVLNSLINIARRYYRLLLKGLMDSNGNVIVRVVKDLNIGNISYCADSMTSLPVLEALMLSELGYVKILDEL